MTKRTDWSEEFFRRFYVDERTRVITAVDLAIEGQWLGATIRDRLRIPIRAALDLGSGTGHFTDGLDRVLEIKTRRVDMHGPDERAERLDIRDVPFHGPDLLVCRDVLHYFSDPDAGEILRRMNVSLAPAIYLRVATSRDALTPESDDQIVRRPARWYRDRLSAYGSMGFGLFIRRDAFVALSELELPKH